MSTVNDTGVASPPTPASPTVAVTVVIPTYNFGRFIEEAVASVLSQDVRDLEVIVIDDGSTDDTGDRLARIADPRVRRVQLDHVGVGAARNYGLSVARGRHVAFLDADDRWRPGKLRRQLDLLESEPQVGFVFTNFVRFDDQGFHQTTQFDLVPEMASMPTRPSRNGNGRVINGDTFSALTPLAQLPCWTQAMLVRAELAREVQFPVDMKLSQDLYYIVNIYSRARGAYIDDPLVEVRRHSGNSYRRADVKLLPDLDALTRSLRTVTRPDHKAVLRHRIGKTWLAAGYHFFWAGNAGAAAQAYLKALRYPGARARAVLRLLASPLAPLLSRWRGRDTSDFPSARP
jgi:glycosyltransferase involved in cell wall biosynthesis